MKDTQFLGNCHTQVRTQLRRYRILVDAAGSFYFVAAHHLTHSPPIGVACWEICRSKDCGGPPCVLAHVDAHSNLTTAIAHTSADRRRVAMCRALGKGLQEVDTATVEVTAGYVMYEELRARGFSALHARLCPDTPACPRGARCLYIHLNASAASAPPLSDGSLMESGLALSKCFENISRGSLASFLQRLAQLHIRTVGDLQALSPAIFDALVSKASGAEELEHWLMLAGLRRFDGQHPVSQALLSFNGVTPKSVENLPRTMQTMEQLWTMSRGAFYSLVGVLPLEVIDACEKLRQRNDEVSYHGCLISQLPRDYFISTMIQTILGARDSYHCSWRKHDKSRPIIISLITFVDAEKCHCRRGESKMRAALSQSLRSASLRLSESVRAVEGGVSPRSAAATVAATEDIVWCSCERRFEIACNYELSTPSGSRCCEQNCMGKIASTGAPTDSLREVFVFGTPSSKGDPNPMFPCGVCENMLRRIAKDVYSTHGGDLTLIMFDHGNQPTKIIMVPMSEVSLRDSNAFQAFVQEVTAREDPVNLQ